MGNLAGRTVHARQYAKALAPYACCCHINKREIDCVLARHYRFTEEELDFIINYGIKYRMGRDAEGGDE
ncbi:MAG: hypothetical protein ACREVY_16710 [Gammaproteobacteria bacterium]